MRLLRKAGTRVERALDARLWGLNLTLEAMGDFGGFERGQLLRAVLDSDLLAAAWGPKEGREHPAETVDKGLNSGSNCADLPKIILVLALKTHIQYLAHRDGRSPQSEGRHQRLLFLRDCLS